ELPGTYDPARQPPEAVDLDGDLVARAEEDLRLAEDPDAGRRAGGDQVARRQRDRLRDEAEDLVDAEDHVRGRRVLHPFAVQDRADRQRLRMGDLLRRHELRADRAERVERLPARPLPVPELEVARRDVVQADVAGDAAALADDDAELRLEVDLA